MRFDMTLLLFSGFIAATMPLLAATDENQSVRVRTVVKTHPQSGVAESRPGASNLPKSGEGTAATPSFLRPEIVYIPKPEVSDE